MVYRQERDTITHYKSIAALNVDVSFAQPRCGCPFFCLEIPCLTAISISSDRFTIMDFTQGSSKLYEAKVRK